MKKNKKLIIIIVIIIVIIVIGVVIYKKNEKKKADALINAGKPSGTGKPVNTGAYTPSGQPVADVFSGLPTGSLPIKYGDKSKLVFLLQTSLNKIKGSGLTVDGIFGDMTKAALQSSYGVAQVDGATAQKIYMDVYNQSQSDSSLTSLENTLNSFFKSGKVPTQTPASPDTNDDDTTFDLI